MKKCGVIVLGNGYDLFHGNKTSYTDFINDVKDKLDNNIWIRYFSQEINLNGWIDLENEMKDILDKYKMFKSEFVFFNLYQHVPIKHKKILEFLGMKVVFHTESYQEEKNTSNGIKKVNKKRKIYDYCICESYKTEFFDGMNIKYAKIDKRIIKDFVEVRNELKYYINKNINENENYNKQNVIYEELRKYEHLIVLNFNYTNTLEFYNNNINNIFIHGSTSNNIILGHNQIDDLTFSLFNKKVQAQSEGLNYKHEFREALSKIKKLEFNFDFIVLGHSFDQNDHDIISWIYKELYDKSDIDIKKFRYFYYKNEFDIDKINKIFNIRKFFNESITILKERKKVDLIIKGEDYLNFLEKENRIEGIMLQ